MGSWAIRASGLYKDFHPPRRLRHPWRRPNAIRALDGVDLEVDRGELFGLLGPNGAGKTTLIKVLCTLIVPTDGSAHVLGHNLDQEAPIKRSVGLVVSDERSFYWRLSARRNLAFFATMLGLNGDAAHRRIETVLDAVDLTEMADRRFSHLSTGMRQRVAIARGLLNRPQLLFMDEPTRSLDPIATGRLHTLIRRLVDQEGMTVFLTTHALDEAEKLCDRIALMVRGRIRACASPEQMRRDLRPGQNYRFHLRCRPATVPIDRIVHLEEVRLEPAQDDTTWLHFYLRDGAGELSTVLGVLASAGITILQISSQVAGLDQVFAHYAEGEEAT